MINILLSGDNAVVIALASRSLPPRQQKQAILLGSLGAIVLRVILTFFAVALLTLPFLKIVGGLLLIWIGVKMLIQDEEDAKLDAHSGLWAAIKTIIIADFVMSLDNVLGVAAAAKGNTVLLILGLAISIPLIVYGSTLVLKLMNRFGFIVVAGAGLLGWVAGEMLVTDPVLGLWVSGEGHWAHIGAPVVATTIVVATGMWLAARARAMEPVPAAAGVGALALEPEPEIQHQHAAFTPAQHVIHGPRQAAATNTREAPGHSFAVEPPHDAGVALAKTESSPVDTPPGYRWVSRPWRTLPNGRRAYAALHGEGAFRSLAPVSSHLREPRKH
jgi:YjbE family integral membrane protein